jgi:hypothetical protein
MSDTANTSVVPMPPYVSFPTLKTLLKSFQEHGPPGRIDRTVLPTFSGSVAGQLIPALRFLGLINIANHPTPRLEHLIKAYGTDEWPGELKIVLEEAYGPLGKLNLQTAAPSQFDEAFTKAYPGADNVVRKCKTFYLAAAAEAKIPISPFIMRNKKPRSAPAKKRTANPAENKQNGTGQSGNKTIDPPPATERKLSEQLLAVLDDTAIDKNVTDAVLTLLPYLRQKGK